MGGVKDFAWFWALLAGMSRAGEREEMKRGLVLQFTSGRTESLREMERWEYDRMCQHMEACSGLAARRKAARSRCLLLMQKLGIDTSDWQRVNAFCQDRRICGKPFRYLVVEELAGLERKLRSIGGHGGLRPMVRRDEPVESRMVHLLEICESVAHG